MGFLSDVWGAVRDPLESAAVLAGNYVLPGSALVTSNLASKGSQQQLDSPLGQLAQLGTGVGGAFNGNLANYGKGLNAIGLGGAGASMGIPGAMSSETAALMQAYPGLTMEQASALTSVGYDAASLSGVPLSEAATAADNLIAQPSLWSKALDYSKNVLMGAGGSPKELLGQLKQGNVGQPNWAQAGVDVETAKLMSDAARERTDLMREQAGKYEAMGAPYRQKLSDLYANPESYLSSSEVQKPVQMGSDILARSLSTHGNPIGSGNALQQMQDYSSGKLYSMLGSEKDRLAGFGGLSGYNAAAPTATTNYIGSNAANLDPLMYGLGTVGNDIFGTARPQGIQPNQTNQSRLMQLLSGA